MKEQDNKSVQSKLMNMMAYGTLTKGELPGELEDYNVSLVRQYHRKSPPVLKLRFTSRRPNSQADFYLKIDEVREPANSIILVKYSQNQGIVSAKATNRIKKKMILSVQKQEKDRHQVLQAEQENSDSDIPRGKPLYQYIKTQLHENDDGKARKKRPTSPNEWDQQDSN